MDKTDTRRYIILLILGLCYLVLTGLAPHDRLTWFLEIFPILIALPVLLKTYQSFPLTKWDMFLALCGAILSLTLLSRLHDRQLADLK